MKSSLSAFCATWSWSATSFAREPREQPYLPSSSALCWTRAFRQRRRPAIVLTFPRLSRSRAIVCAPTSSITARTSARLSSKCPYSWDLLTLLSATTSSRVVPPTPCTRISSAAAATMRARVAAPRAVSWPGAALGRSTSSWYCLDEIVQLDVHSWLETGVTGGARMRAIVVTDEAAGTAGMTLAERPEPRPAINDVIVEVHASGFVPTELTWPPTWTDRLDRDRTPSIPGHELAGVVTELGYGTAGLSIGQRVFGLTDWTRDGTLAEYVAVEARNLAPLPGDVDYAVGASLPISGLTAWQGLFVHARFRAGQRVLAHGAAGAVGSMVVQLAREAGAHVIGTGRASDRQAVLDFGAHEFVDLAADALEEVGGVDLVFDVIGGDIQKRSAALVRAGGTLVTIVGPAEAHPAEGLAIDFVVESDRGQLGEIVQRVRDGRLRTNIGTVSALEDAVAAFNPTERRQGKTIITVRP